MSITFPSYIIENKDFLQNIAKTRSQKVFASLIENATEDQINSIIEIVYNILNGNIVLKTSKRKRLAATAEQYRRLIRIRKPQKVRHKLIKGFGPIGGGKLYVSPSIKTGSGVVTPLLAAIIGPLLGQIAQSVLERKLKK